MRGHLAVCALHASAVLEKFLAESAFHDAVETLLDKFVTVELVDVLLLLTHGTFAVESSIDVSLATFYFLVCVRGLVSQDSSKWEYLTEAHG